MKKQQSSFQSSINIRFDLGKKDFANRFIPTSSHVLPFQSILNGFMGGGQKSHIISGPYGSGKSLMGVILCGIFSKKFNQSTLSELSSKFELIDANVSKVIDKVSNTNFTYIPVILEGNVHNLHRSLISSIYKALQNDGTTVIMPTLILDILETVRKWEEDYPDTYSLFKERLSESRQQFDYWIKQIENYNQEAIAWFTSIYPNLTSGSQFVPKYAGELVSQINYLLGELNKIGKGLFVVHDEFGRFLQSLNSSEIHEVMQDLQDVAELANHNDYQNFNLLLISHKNMRQYAHRLSEDMQKEFQRIEKRFAVHHIESDQSTFVRIANLNTKHMRLNWNQQKEREYLQDGLVRFNLFTELTHTEKNSLIIEGSYPIHPVTLYSMPRLANIVAQNERTLFTFLESNQLGGLNYDFERFGSWYTADKLFDYFEPAFDEFEYESNVKKNYLLFKRLQKRLVPSEHLEDQIRILKLISLWDIANINTRIVLNKEFLSFALMLKKETIEILLDELYNSKIIRFLDDESRFILYEGSIVDVNKEIEERLLSSTFSLRQKLDFAEQLLDKQYYLPKRYNDEKSITRFAKVSIVHGSEMFDDKFAQKLSETSDFHIIFIVSDKINEIQNLQGQTHVISKRNDKVIFVYSDEPVNNFFLDLEKLLIIDRLEQDKVFLIQDRFLLDELIYMKRTLLFNITTQLRPYLKFSKDCKWIYKGENLTVIDERSLSRNLSKIMFELFPYTPEIRNEAFNRRNIAKVQEKSAYKVIDKILQKIRTNNTDPIDIIGYGPDYLIYATVLKNHEIDPLHPELVKDESILALRKHLLDALQKGNGSLTELLEVFIERPFSVRKPVIPVLLPAILGKEWKHLLFYNNGMFMQYMDGETLWKMVYDSTNYSFAFQSIDDKYSEVITLVENCFASHIREEERGLTTPVYLSKVLLRWYNSLPRIARVTNKQSSSSNLLRQIVRISEVRPLEAIDQLNDFTKMGQDNMELENAKLESENYIEKHKQYLEKILTATLQQNTYDDLRAWCENQPIFIRKMSKLISGVLNSNSDNYIDNISQGIVGVNRKDWSDATNEVFQTELLNELASIRNTVNEKNYIHVNDGVDSLVFSKVELSTKSKLIYDDISRKLKYTGRTVTKDELLIVLWNLMQDISNTNRLQEHQESVKQGG